MLVMPIIAPLAAMLLRALPARPPRRSATSSLRPSLGSQLMWSPTTLALISRMSTSMPPNLALDDSASARKHGCAFGSI